MKIAIYDSEHFETTYTVIRALSFSSNQVSLFVTEEVASSLKELLSAEESLSMDWIILQRANIQNSAIIYRYCCKKGIEILWLSTVSYHHLLFGTLSLLLRKTKTVITIHDANSFFRPDVAPSTRSMIRYAGKKLLNTSVDGFSTLLTSTKKYIEDNFRPAIPIGCVPGSFYTGSKISSLPDVTSLVIVIPGSFDPKRRNYNLLFALAEKWNSPGRKLEIVLLGGAKDAEASAILHQLRDLSTPTITFTVYEQAHISQLEYDRQLSRCDFVYAPLQKMFLEESAVPEQYGITKSSGCFFDAIRFGKPLLLPETIFLPGEIAPQTIVHPSTSEMAFFLHNLTQEELNRIHTTAINNSKRFTLDTISKQLTAFLGSLP